MLLNIERPALRFRLWLFDLLLFLDHVLKCKNVYVNNKKDLVEIKYDY
jgi:hypothetical protein